MLGIAPTLLLFAISSAVVIAACGDRCVLAAALSIAPAVFIGRISFGLHLWHVPVFVALGAKTTDPGAETVAAVALTLAVAVAVASYYLVELPFLRRKRSSRSPAVLPVPAPAPS